MRIRKVLLVDDEPDLRKIGALSLKMVGRWEVVVAASGAEAIALLSEENPDLIILDVMMPGMDGVATFRALRGPPTLSRIPVIFMTAKTQKQEIDGYLALGAAGVITKPFDPMTLPQEVERIVAGARIHPSLVTRG